MSEPWTAPSPVDRSRLVTGRAGRIFVADLGPKDGELVPIVLLHGLLVTHYSFRKIMSKLASNRRVLAVDLPGCGESDRPTPAQADHYALPWLVEQVLEAIAAVGVKRFDLVGHSFGGTVALQLTATNPDVVRRLVLVDPVAFTMEMPLEGRLALLPRLGPFLFKQLYRRADLRRYLARAMSTPELLEEQSLHVYWDRLGRRGGREAAYAMLLQMANLDPLRERLETISAPTVVAWGDRDHLMPVEIGEQLVKLLPDATLEVIDGCGHAVPEERPGVLYELIVTHTGDRGSRVG